MSVNKIILIGRLGQDPELKFIASGTAVCNFSLATDRKWNDKEGKRQQVTTWHKIVAWGKQAETIKEYLSKGSQVYIEGRVDNRSYEDKEGVKKYISEVVVEQFRFIGSKSDNEQAPPDKKDDGSPF